MEWICRLRLPFPPPSLARTIRSLGFAGECLGQHSGSDQQADLGDGRGYRASPTPLLFFPSPFSFQYFFKFLKGNETAVMRYNYGDATLGTCKESVLGGNHFRYWVQEGSDADRCSSPSRRVSFHNSHRLFFRTHHPDIAGPFSWLFRMNSQLHVSP